MQISGHGLYSVTKTPQKKPRQTSMRFVLTHNYFDKFLFKQHEFKFVLNSISLIKI